MATYDNLPIYHASYMLLLELFRFTREFTREYKYTLGESIKKETVEMITHIYKANSDKVGRLAHIQSARKNIEVIRLFVRLLRDLRQVTLEKFVTLNQSIETVSKQLLAWQKSALPASSQTLVE
jgi:hypothetical protein